MAVNEYSERHPHEAEIPPTVDDEGRCLVCLLTVAREDAEAACEAERRWRKEMVEAIFTAKELGCECSMVINKLLADQPKGNDA